MLTQEQYTELLSPYFPEGLRQGVELRVGRVEALTGLPRSMSTPTTVASVLRRPRPLRTIAVSEDGLIILDPQHADLDSAAGLALLAHEYVHQEQFAALGARPFELQYEEAERTTPASQPYLNPFELPAYQKEREVYCREVARGRRPGAWVPLGVQLWGCPVQPVVRGSRVRCITW